MTVKKNGAGKKKDNRQSSDGAGRLLSALLTGVNRAHPYLPKADAAMEEHIDALYRIVHTAPPAASTQALMLLFQLAVGSGDTEDATSKNDESVTARKDRFYRALYSKVTDGDMFTGRQLTLFFNLLYKALKYDTKAERICAFSKRLVHTSLHLSSSIICGVLFLLSEIISCHPEVNKEVEASMSVVFDPSKREPSVAFSEKVQLEKNLWELSLLAHHFHPSVSKFTADSSGAIYFKGDPLKDFSLTPFLDKFAFRNPKSLETLSKQIKGGIAARKSGLSTMTALPLNDPSYLKATEIAEDEKFFHQFFVERAKRDEIKGIVRGTGEGKDDSDLEDEALNATEADEVSFDLLLDHCSNLADSNYTHVISIFILQNDDFDGNTDSEEEAFVNDLAEKLMESSGHGKVNLDDEDPDMDDWSDFDDDSVDGDGSEDDEDAAAFGNEDAFMDAPSSDEDFEGDAIDTNNFDDDDDDDDDHFPMMLGDDEDFSDDEEEALPTKKKKKSESLYADADEYEKILEEELNAMGKSEEGNDSVNSSHRKKKKRKIK